MKRKIYISISILVITSNFYLNSQTIDVQWVTNYGGSQWDHALGTLLMSDSSLITTGYTYSNDFGITINKGSADLFVSKQNLAGEFEWIITFGGSNFDQGTCLVQTSDSTFIVGGNIESNDGDVEMSYGARDIMLLKMNLNGEIIWQKIYGGTSFEQVNSIICDVEGGYVFCGETYSNDIDVDFNHATDSPDFWVVKIDSMGNIIWENCFGNSDNNRANNVIQLSDSTFMVVGSTLDSGGDVTMHYGGVDWWVIHISNDGELIWEKTYGGSGLDLCQGVLDWGNGKYLLAGETLSDDFDIPDLIGVSDAWLIMIDSLGNIIWNKTYGGSDGENLGIIKKLSKSAFISTGFSLSDDYDVLENLGDADCWVVIFDSLGNLLNQKSIGGTELDRAYSISVLDSSAIFLSGYSRSNDVYLPANYGDFDAISLKINICWNKYFLDYDDDGFGDINSDSVSCGIPIGYVIDSNDCNDSANLINPGAKELCNYLDDNCDGIVDEGMTFIQSFEDFDGDNFGNYNIDSIACEIPIGYVLDNTDCDDSNPDIYPGAIEILNGLDDDCNQMADDGLSIENPRNIICSISPNPSIDIINIVSNINGNGIYEIISATGQFVLFGDWDATNSSISILDIPAGVYTINLCFNANLASLTFIKLN